MLTEEQGDSWMTFLSEHQELLHKFKNGDPKILKQVYLHYAPMVVAFVRKGVSERDGERPYFLPGVDNLFDLEDIVQETFLRAFAQTTRDNYDGSSLFRNYLFAIAKNVQLDRFRKKSLTSSEKQQLMDLEEHSAQKSVSLSLLEKELHSLVFNFGNQLKGRSRDIFFTHLIEGKSLRDTAKAVGITLVVVRYQVNKLKKSLKKHLAKQGWSKND
jgi:RNA polymerase sigma factor (sigma-70 family)